MTLYRAIDSSGNLIADNLSVRDALSVFFQIDPNPQRIVEDNGRYSVLADLDDDGSTLLIGHMERVIA
jgi:hypothetical protein